MTEPSSFEDIWDLFAKKYPEKVVWQKIHNLISHTVHKKAQPIEISTVEILKEFGVSDRALAAEISRRWEYSCDQVTAFPESLDVLRSLREDGYKLGLITNTSQYGWESADRVCGIGSLFDHLALSFRVGRVKAESEIFEWMEKESGFSGKSVVMIGDSFKSDYEAPRKRGWNSILLERGAPRHPEAKLVIHSLLEVKEMLAKL